jgi:hypothetical protein
VNREDAELQRRVMDGVADFRALTGSLISTGETLPSSTRIQLASGYKVTDSKTYVYLFDSFLQRSRNSFLIRQRGTKHKVSFEKFLQSVPSDRDRKLISNELKLKAWNALRGPMFELLCLLVTLRSVDQGNLEIHDVLAPIGPLEFEEDRMSRWLWTRPRVLESVSGMPAYPDIVVTNSSQAPTPANILRIVECKNVASIGASVIRTEYGKARDLGVASYLLLSYFRVPGKRVGAARALGLDLTDIGLYGPSREETVATPELISERIDVAVKRAASNNNVLRHLDEDVGHIRRKLLPLSENT